MAVKTGDMQTDSKSLEVGWVPGDYPVVAGYCIIRTRPGITLKYGRSGCGEFFYIFVTLNFILRSETQGGHLFCDRL